MPKRRKPTEEEVELANRIWELCREGTLLQDSRGRPSYILALSLARFLLSKAYEVGFDDPLAEIDWNAIIDCELEYSEMIREYQRWLSDSVGKPKSIDSIVYSQIDMLRMDIESIKHTISQLESLTPDQLAEMGLTEEERQRQLEELRSNLAKLEAELKRLERQVVTRRVRVKARAPEREKTRALIEYAIKRPETTLGRFVRQTVLGEFIARRPAPPPPSPVSEEEALKEAQRVYSEFMSFHNELEAKLKPISDKINMLVGQLHSLEKQFMDASEAGDLERLKRLLPDAERVLKELSEAFEEAKKLTQETMPAIHEWRRRKDEALRRLFELRRGAPGKAEEIQKLIAEISALSAPQVKWEAPPEWARKDERGIMERARSLFKRLTFRIAELEYRQRRVGVLRRKLKDVLRYEDFINKLRERLGYYGVPADIASMFIGEAEEELRQAYEEVEYAELEDVIARFILHFKTEFIPLHFTTLYAHLLVARGVRVDHPREILLYGMWVRPRVYYLKPRFDSWASDCERVGCTVVQKPITIRPGKTHLIIDPAVAIESTIVAVRDDTIYLVNAPAIGYVFDPDARYVEYYYYTPCPLLDVAR
jgi:predicted  nucleic acid-binding Zn-ribbon protein